MTVGDRARACVHATVRMFTLLCTEVTKRACNDRVTGWTVSAVLFFFRFCFVLREGGDGAGRLRPRAPQTCTFFCFLLCTRSRADGHLPPRSATLAASPLLPC